MTFFRNGIFKFSIKPQMCKSWDYALFNEKSGKFWGVMNFYKIGSFHAREYCLNTLNHCIIQAINGNSFPRFVVESAIHTGLPYAKFIYREMWLTCKALLKSDFSVSWNFLYAQVSKLVYSIA